MKSNSKEDVLINILTRTSNRPIGFLNCHQSIIQQSYKNFNHIISYDNDNDLNYINAFDLKKIKVNKVTSDPEIKQSFIYAPYNLYCNELLKEVKNGWILFLDDDDSLLHHKVLEEAVKLIKKMDNDTMIVWQIRYPNGKTLPLKKHFKQKKIELNHIGTSNILFHSKYKDLAKWDEWKGADFRFINVLFNQIPKKKWIEKVNIQINNYGDFGKQNDIDNIVTNNKIFYKSWFWWLLPKYHTSFLGFRIFNKIEYKKLKKRFLNKISNIKK